MVPQRIYRVVSDNTTISVASDLLEWVGGSSVWTCLVAFYFGTLEAGDAEDEGLRLRLISAYSTSGSGGSSFTPLKQTPGAAAFSGTAEINNTTVANGGSPVSEHLDTFNARAGGGIAYRPTIPELIWFPSSTRVVLNAPTAPADAVSGSFTAYLGEFG